MLILRAVPRSGVRLSAALGSAETTTALAIAHTAAGGEPPTPGWLLVVAATVYGASLVVLRRRAPVRVVLPAMVALQVLLHAWLVALTAGTSMHGHAGGDDALLGLTWPMLLAHLGAGLVAAAAWVLRRRAFDVLVGWTEGPVPDIAHRGRVAARRIAPRLQGRFLAAGPTRGPPSVLSAAA